MNNEQVSDTPTIHRSALLTQLASLVACAILQGNVTSEDFLFENMCLNQLLIAGSVFIQINVIATLLKEKPALHKLCIAGLLGIIPSLASALWIIQSATTHSSFYSNKSLVTFRDFGKQTILVFLEETELDPNIVVFSRMEGVLGPIKIIRRVGRYIRMESASWKPSGPPALEIYNGRRSTTLLFNPHGDLTNRTN